MQNKSLVDLYLTNGKLDTKKSEARRAHLKQVHKTFPKKYNCITPASYSSIASIVFNALLILTEKE